MLAPFLQPFFAIFGAVDPVGCVPVFLTLTGGDDAGSRRLTALKAVASATAILVLFTLAGSAVLDVFAVSIESFRIAGGLVLAALGFQILFDISFGTPVHHEGHRDVSMVPLATPLLAGPGTISMSIVIVKEYGYLLTLAAVAANMVLTLLVFWFAGRLHRFLGKQGTEAFAKIMGLIVVAIGVELVRKGLAG